MHISGFSALAGGAVAVLFASLLLRLEMLSWDTLLIAAMIVLLFVLAKRTEPGKDTVLVSKQDVAQRRRDRLEANANGRGIW